MPFVSVFLHFHIVRAHRSPHSLLFWPSLPHARFMSWYSRNIVGLINLAMPRIPNSVPFCTIMLPHSPLLLSSAVNTPRSHLSPVVSVGRLFHCFTLLSSLLALTPYHHLFCVLNRILDIPLRSISHTLTLSIPFFISPFLVYPIFSFTPFPHPFPTLHS